jgi:NADH dehydrogenase (ubiquinone) Fe-S protein 5
MDIKALRTMKLQAAYRKAEAAHPRENAPKSEQIRSLGLLGKEEEATALLSKA